MLSSWYATLATKRLTVNFSRIDCVPWKGSFSKVSMELFLWKGMSVLLKPLLPPRILLVGKEPYVKSSQLRAVPVEGLVVELNKLFCRGVRYSFKSKQVWAIMSPP